VSNRILLQMSTIDLISVDEATGHARLHLLVEGEWINYDAKMEWILERLNTYIGFVASGQLAAREKYQHRAVKFLVHCEMEPPPLALITFGRMKRHLEEQAIQLGVTVGREAKKEISLPSSG
jgi:hypothetical protein